MGSGPDQKSISRRLRLGLPLLLVAVGVFAMGCEPEQQTSDPAPRESRWREHRTRGRHNQTPTTTPASTTPPTTRATTPTTKVTTPTTKPPVATPPAPPAPPAAGGWWKPAVGVDWQIQLSTPVDESFDVPVYDIDGESNSAAVVASLHAKGRKVICYIDVGGAETYRSDFSLIPQSVLGNVVDGWPDERWIDVRQIDLLRPVMAARMDMCKSKGFDAVDPDMVEAYAADSGFPISYADQLTFNRWIAQLAHERGMGVGLKGDVEQVPDLVSSFDFVVNEQCAEYDECDTVAAFSRAGKAVFHIEYDLAKSSYCAESNALQFSSLRKNLDLDAWSDPC